MNATTKSTPTSLTIRRPDDWHLHLRDSVLLSAVIGHSANHFGRALVMPNLVPPVVTLADAAAYRQRIVEQLPDNTQFTPLMTLYLTEGTDPKDVVAARDAGVATAVKLYPAGATTNSQSGVRDINKVMGVLETMADIGLPLCVHGEVTDPEVDIFDREARFIEQVLSPLRQRLPELPVVFEHITTKDGVDYVQQADAGLAATITTHHLMINRNHLLVGGIRPHYYCLPIAKREQHRQALRHAATSGDRRFFLGTDSAPHLDSDKESACGCAGVFNTANAIACVAQVFEEENALAQLEAFTSIHGSRFYGVTPNEGTITLVRHADPVDYPKKVETPSGTLTVFDPGVPLHWQVEQ